MKPYQGEYKCSLNSDDKYDPELPLVKSKAHGGTLAMWKLEHDLWTTAGSSPARVAMATVQAQMISGRYRTQQLCSHWSPHTTGFCLLSSSCASTIEDLPHILSCCLALLPARENLQRFSLKLRKISYSQGISPGLLPAESPAVLSIYH